MLSRIESSLAAIKTRLLEDEDIRKLLFYDSNDALVNEAPKKESVKEYITLRPIYQFENKENYNQNSMINIYMTQATPGDDLPIVDSILQINVVCNIDNWELVNDKIRPIQIANKIIKLVNNRKFTTSNKLVFSTLTDLIISKTVCGYALLFELTDGSGEQQKF